MSEMQSAPHGRSLYPPFGTVSVHGNTSGRGHCMWVHVLAEPMPGPQVPTTVMPPVTYRELHLGFSRVLICLCNLRSHSIKIPTKMVVGKVMPANQLPPIVLPTGTLEEPISNPYNGWILEALDLQGLGDGPNLSKNRPVTWTCVEPP